ncbi:MULTISPECIES: restriction endonuclease subunit S [Streptomyces]|uniref:Restriction endonuclease subunit S n=1 Tax=Streptomyces sudanensis TaxID=436397 RepID=A0ABY4TF60_9ACTN|nr:MULTISPECIES: restriction endonuclease subunit S [Streptomyces]URN16186.1 restriction endonuclease subunit S [Streptomyces sudanensis]
MRASGWVTTRLSKVLDEVFAGAWGDSPSDSMNPNVHVLRATNINNEGHIDYSKPAPRVFSAQEVTRKRLITGDLIVEASGGGPGTPVGRVALHRGDVDGRVFACSNFFRAMRPNLEIVDPDFLVQVLVKVYRSPEIWRYQQQTTGLVNLKFRDYLEQPVLIPPLNEQRRIVEVINAMAAQERAIMRSIAKLDQVREGVTAAQLVGVELTRFEDVIEYGPQNGIYKQASSYGIDGTPIVRIDSFRGGPSDFTRNLLRVSLTAPEISSYGLAVGDIVINRVNTPELVGKSTSVRELTEPTVFESNMMRCKVRADRAVPAFVEMWLGSALPKKHFRVRAKSAISQASINGDDVRDCPFPCIEVREQRAILDRLAAVTVQQRVEEAELVKLRNTKQGLVDDLLSGRS